MTIAEKVKEIVKENPAVLFRLEILPRQYMHNKENAVTMRLSAH